MLLISKISLSSWNFNQLLTFSFSFSFSWFSNSSFHLKLKTSSVSIWLKSVLIVSKTSNWFKSGYIILISFANDSKINFSLLKLSRSLSFWFSLFISLFFETNSIESLFLNSFTNLLELGKLISFCINSSLAFLSSLYFWSLLFKKLIVSWLIGFWPYVFITIDETSSSLYLTWALFFKNS